MKLPFSSLQHAIRMAAALGCLLSIALQGFSLAADSSEDFSIFADGSVLAIVMQPDGRLIVGGYFTNLGGHQRDAIARLNADGTIDDTFTASVNGVVESLAIQSDGKILVGGYFGHLNDQSRAYIGRLNADGTLDDEFDPGANFSVRALAVQPNGQIIVGGSFRRLGGEQRSYIGRLNADGSLDMSFDPGADKIVTTIGLQPDGRILVGGGFTTLAGESVAYMGRLNPDGTLHGTFNAGTDGGVGSISLQPDGKMIITGGFTSVHGGTKFRLARLHGDGSLDAEFICSSARWSPFVSSLQTDGRILIGGGFFELCGEAHFNVGRLDPDGILDSSFTNSFAHGVNALILQPDGKLVAGLARGAVSGDDGQNIVRHHNTHPATQSLTAEDSTITWLRGGTAPEVWRTTFEHSSDGAQWTTLGAGSRIDGGWELTGVAVPENGELRARGFVQAANSSWFVETIIPLGLTAPLLKAKWDQGALRLTVYGDVGAEYAIESSDDLSSMDNWQALSEINLPTNPWEFVDANAGETTSRFYRVRQTSVAAGDEQ